MNKKILSSAMIMAIIFVINGKYASANTVHLKDLTSYLITPKPWPKGCWICPICGLCCSCEESKPETESVSSCYVGDEKIEKQEIITKCAEHTDEFGTGPYMCGIRTIAGDKEYSCLPQSYQSELCTDGLWNCCFTDNCNKA